MIKAIHSAHCRVFSQGAGVRRPSTHQLGIAVAGTTGCFERLSRSVLSTSTPVLAPATPRQAAQPLRRRITELKLMILAVLERHSIGPEWRWSMRGAEIGDMLDLCGGACQVLAEALAAIWRGSPGGPAEPAQQLFSSSQVVRSSAILGTDVTWIIKAEALTATEAQQRVFTLSLVARPGSDPIPASQMAQMFVQADGRGRESRAGDRRGR